MSETKKKRGGRPPINATPLTVRVPPDLLADLDAWISEQSDPKPSRPDAMRRLVSDYLVTMGLRKP
jgi:hypothetical protein